MRKALAESIKVAKFFRLLLSLNAREMLCVPGPPRVNNQGRFHKNLKTLRRISWMLSLTADAKYLDLRPISNTTIAVFCWIKGYANF